MKDGSYSSGSSARQFLKNLLKCVAVSLILTFVILVIAAILLCFTDFPEKYTLPSAIAATVLGVLAGSYKFAGWNPDKRIISALILALIYAVLAYIVGCLVQGKVMISGNTALFTAIVLATGAIGGILAGRPAKPAGKYKGGSGILPNRFKKAATSWEKPAEPYTGHRKIM
ncbi:MAG TPA: TIGR04086 family membrane protein [Thermoclostridium sp.]|nr:TIGR04086 family membrane protein [Thermoclostridium sp.]